ncbi:Arm DNA-binding domain-containing protein [Chryseobacterium sp.]|uniref:Arm DNA-binding domain-containing protein n=1 Tax=Chryseobacterium sp. TaxID=1871047 RepID=UPI00391738C6
MKTKDWNSKTGKIKDNSSQTMYLNSFLDNMMTKVFDSYLDLLVKDKIITTETLANKVFWNW